MRGSRAARFNSTVTYAAAWYGTALATARLRQSITVRNATYKLFSQHSPAVDHVVRRLPVHKHFDARLGVRREVKARQRRRGPVQGRRRLVERLLDCSHHLQGTVSRTGTLLVEAGVETEDTGKD